MKEKNLTNLIGIGALGVVILSYCVGYFIGSENAQRYERKEIIEFLEMEKYDARQNAKYAGTAEKQDELLNYADSLNKFLEKIK